jgi:FkbM family methyltransferase
MDERRKAGSTWIMPKEKPRASGKCSQTDLEACTDAEKRLLKARPPALLPDGTYGSALVQSSSGSGALTVKAVSGDDCLEQFLLTQSDLRNKASGVFVDIGAGNGVDGSRTRKFETLRGWTGLCVEPYEELHQQLKENRKCTPLNVAVGREEGTRKFSSKSRKLSPSGNVAVDVKPLGKLLHDANYVGKHIDLLRVGTNGTEMDILRRSLERVHARTSTPAPSVARKCMS